MLENQSQGVRSRQRLYQRLRLGDPEGPCPPAGSDTTRIHGTVGEPAGWSRIADVLADEPDGFRARESSQAAFDPELATPVVLDPVRSAGAGPPGEPDMLKSGALRFAHPPPNPLASPPMRACPVHQALVDGVVEFLVAPARLVRRAPGAFLTLKILAAIMALVATLAYLSGGSPSPAASASASASPVAFQMAPLGSDPASLVFLVLGVDSMADRGRSDTILLVNLMLERKKVHILSIPRDMYAHMQRPDGVVQDKINHAYRFGGVDLVKKSLEGELGIRIDHYGVIDYDLFRKTVDLMGGIPLYVDRRMYYVDRAGGLKVDLFPGEQALNGDHALQYVRFRHDAMGDLGRVSRQQKFVGAALNKIKDPKLITYLAYKLPSLLQYVTTDVSTQESLALLWKIRDMTPKDLQVKMVPGDGKLMDTPIHKNKLWFFVADRPELEKLTKDWFLNPDASELPRSHGPKAPAGASPAAKAVAPKHHPVLSGSGRKRVTPAGSPAPAKAVAPKHHPVHSGSGRKRVTPAGSPAPVAPPSASMEPAAPVGPPPVDAPIAPSGPPASTSPVAPPSPAALPHALAPVTEEEADEDAVGAVILGQAPLPGHDAPAR